MEQHPWEKYSAKSKSKALQNETNPTKTFQTSSIMAQKQKETIKSVI